jgi:hypothetical protein
MIEMFFFADYTSVSSPVLTTIPIARPLATVVDMKAFPLQSPIGILLVYRGKTKN